jgi:hypothetical protein
MSLFLFLFLICLVCSFGHGHGYGDRRRRPGRSPGALMPSLLRLSRCNALCTGLSMLAMQSELLRASTEH